MKNYLILATALSAFAIAPLSAEKKESTSERANKAMESFFSKPDADKKESTTAEMKAVKKEDDKKRQKALKSAEESLEKALKAVRKAQKA